MTTHRGVIPGAPQHAMLRRRPGTQEHSLELVFLVPGLQRTASRRTAPGMTPKQAACDEPISRFRLTP